MAGITNFDCEGTLTISSISMNRLAWAVVGDETGRGGLFTLLTSADQRGEDRLLPNTTGVIAYPRRVTRTTHELRIIVAGDVDENGIAVSNYKQGLVANLDYLYTNVVAPVVSTTGTRAATLDLPGLAQRTADIHVTGLRQDRYIASDRGSGWEGSLLISIPAGRFS